MKMTKREIREKAKSGFILTDFGIYPAKDTMRFVVMPKTIAETKKLVSDFLQGEKGWYALKDLEAVKLAELCGFKECPDSNEPVIYLKQGIVLFVDRVKNTPMDTENLDSMLKSFRFRLLMCG